MKFNMGPLGVRVPFQFAKKGSVVDGHGHNFDHVTYIPRGAVLFEFLEPLDPADLFVDEATGTIHLKKGAPCRVTKSVTKSALDGFNMLTIEAGKIHRLTALEDDTIAHCLYTHRNPTGEVVPNFTGWERAYV